MTLPDTAESPVVPHGELPAAVLWDMDGTLVDTEPYWFAAERDLVERFGNGHWPDELAKQVVGFDLLDSAAFLQEHAAVDLPAREIVDRLLDGVIARLQREIPWRPGARELLAELRAAGIPCALVTMSWRRFVDPVLAALPDGSFVATVTGDEVPEGEGKPEPTPYLIGADACGVHPSDCLAIEDSPTGVRSALGAGCRVLGVPNVRSLQPSAGLTVVDSLDGVRIDDLAALFDRARSNASDRVRRRRSTILGLLALTTATIVAVALGRSGSTDDVAPPVADAAPVESGVEFDPWLTFPEGLSLTQMADRVRDRRPDLDAESFLRAAESVRPPASFGAPAATSSPEGLLFPNTYRVEEGGDEAGLVEQMARLTVRIADEEGLVAGAVPLGLTPYEVLIVASMIEKEAGTEADRPLIARVIYNRLAREMLLQIDATLYYDGDRSIPFSELRQIDSPYNTYLRTGLPPTPITNPGQASIRAALNPAPPIDPSDPRCAAIAAEECSLLFYVLSDEDGSHAFSVTYDQHLENVEAASDAGLL